MVHLQLAQVIFSWHCSLHFTSILKSVFSVCFYRNLIFFCLFQLCRLNIVFPQWSHYLFLPVISFFLFIYTGRKGHAQNYSVQHLHICTCLYWRRAVMPQIRSLRVGHLQNECYTPGIRYARWSLLSRLLLPHAKHLHWEPHNFCTMLAEAWEGALCHTDESMRKTVRSALRQSKCLKPPPSRHTWAAAVCSNPEVKTVSVRVCCSNHTPTGTVSFHLAISTKTSFQDKCTKEISGSWWKCAWWSLSKASLNANFLYYLGESQGHFKVSCLVSNRVTY